MGTSHNPAPECQNSWYGYSSSQIILKNYRICQMFSSPYIYIYIFIYCSNNSQPVSRNNEFRPRPGLLVRTHRPLWTWSVTWWDSSDSRFVWSSPSHLVQKRVGFLRKMEGTHMTPWLILHFFSGFSMEIMDPTIGTPHLKNGKACCERWISSFWGRHSMKKSTFNGLV